MKSVSFLIGLTLHGGLYNYKAKLCFTIFYVSLALLGVHTFQQVNSFFLLHFLLLHLSYCYIWHCQFSHIYFLVKIQVIVG